MYGGIWGVWNWVAGSTLLRIRLDVLGLVVAVTAVMVVLLLLLLLLLVLSLWLLGPMFPNFALRL